MIEERCKSCNKKFSDAQFFIHNICDECYKLGKGVGDNKVVIVGCGGFGREVHQLFKDYNNDQLYQFDNFNLLGFISEDNYSHGTKINNLPVLGNLSWFKDHKDVKCVVAIGDPIKRREMVSKLNKIGVSFCSIIHPSVIIGDSVEVGEGCIICAGVILTTNIKIQNHVIINLGCTVGHDVWLKNYVSLMPCVKVNGGVTLYTAVYVGSGTTFIQNITVNPYSVIGAGSVVISNIPRRCTAIGVPAKIIKKYDEKGNLKWKKQNEFASRNETYNKDGVKPKEIDKWRLI